MGNFPSNHNIEHPEREPQQSSTGLRRLWTPDARSPEKVILYPDGSSYFGEVKGIQRNGFGLYISIEGWECESTWTDDEILNGTALVVVPDGSEALQAYENGKVISELFIRHKKKPKMEQSVPALSSPSSSDSTTPPAYELKEFNAMPYGPRARFLASYNSAPVSTPPLYISTCSGSRMFRPKRPSDATSWLIPYDQIQFHERLSKTYCKNCSIVYRGTWLGKEVAIRLFQGFGETNNSLENLISRISRIRHTNLALFMAASVNETDGKIAILTEFFCNGSLNFLKKNNQVLSLQKILHLAKSLACACMYLRKQRFAHGNLRPSNILIDSCGNLKLTDYFVKELEETFHPLPCLKSSSVAYLAPETLRHTPFVPFGVDSASDVYSFGMICAELISGVEPLRNFSVPQIRVLVGYGGYRQPGHPMSRLKALNKLVAKCTLQDPLARPTFERIVVALNSLQHSANTVAEDALITFISGK